MGHAFDARIGANESVFGPSPKAIEAMTKAASEIWQYADSTNFALKTALADSLGATFENVVVGGGIDGLLGELVRLLIEPGDAVVTSAGAYPTFNYHVAGFGGVLHTVPFTDDHEDIDALLTKAAEVDAKLIYLANPDNPMGSWHSGDKIRSALDRIPDGAVLCLDEAYIEFAPEGTAPDIALDDPRVIRFRTFSKAYGMAGARVGYGFGAPELIQSFDKIRNHFGMNRAAQDGALAALQDDDWLAHVKSEVATSKARIAAIARDNGLIPLPSATNFVTIDCGGDGAFAAAVVKTLGEMGVFIRMPFQAPQNRCIRISAGTESDLDALEAALPQALAKVRGA